MARRAHSGAVEPSPAPRGQRRRAGEVDDQLAHRLLELGALELEHRRGRVRLAVGGVRDDPQRGELEREQLVLELGEPRGDQRVVEQRAALVGLGRPLLGLRRAPA